MGKWTEYLVCIIIILYAGTVYSQGLTIGSGTTFSLGNASLYLSGNWSNSGTFNADTGTVMFDGTGNQSITNSSGETFYNLTVAKSSDTVQLQNNITIDGALTFSSGLLTTGSNAVSLGSTATISEASGTGVIGNLTTDRTLSQNVNNTFGGIGVEINAAGSAPGITTVTRVTGTAEIGNSNSSIKRYFDISPATDAGLNATLVFHYDPTRELNSISENSLILFKSTDNGSRWTQMNGTVNTTSHDLTLTGIDSFSRWTAASKINVISVNNPPVFSNIESAAINYTEGQAPVQLTNTITVSDTNNANMASGAVQISTGYMNGEDVLSYTQVGSIVGSWNASTGELTLTGSDTKANYQSALRAVKFGSTGDTLTSTRTVSFVVNDGTVNSNVLTRSIDITPANYPYPAIVLNSSPISFGTVVVNTPSLKTVMIKDTSITALSIDSIYTLTKRFAVNTTSGIVHKTDSLNVTVTFTPDTTGSFTDTLYIHNNSNISLVKIPLSGTSPMPVVLTDLLLVDFGTLQTTNSATQTIKFTNNTVNSLVIDTAYFGTKYFTITGLKFPTTIPDADTLSAALNFNPDSTRIFIDTLYIVNNSSVPLFKIPIDGQKKNVTGIMLEKSGIPDHFDISQNYPNPFNPTTLIKYQLPKSANVSLIIYDITGREVMKVVDKQQNAGYYIASFNGTRLASGVYFYRIVAGDFVSVKKMMLLK